MAQFDVSKSQNTSNDEAKSAETTNEDQKYQFSVGSFNIWCPHWNGSEGNNPQIWKKRHNDILNILCSNGSNEEKDSELQPMNCDIYCLQEFWCDRKPFVRMYENYFKARNYSLHFLKRHARHKPDGIAIAINNNTFKLLNKINYSFTISNRVVLMVELLHLDSKCVINIANTHLTFPQWPYDNELRAEQVRQFIEVLDKNTKDSASVVMGCGDFNCEIDGNEAVQCLKNGYKSSFHTANDGKETVVSHMNHENESVFVDHIFYKTNGSVLEEHSFTINAIDSYVYPRSMKCDTWNREWKLSDHRPVVSTFEMSKIQCI